MQLLRVEMRGFKSFADKTTIHMSPGMTAIVGPNGSGKSNVTDALKWVLGESNVRNLRGQKAEDIIFSGTEKRRPMGTAEVTLVFDNTDNTLEEGLAEVSITRRVYRNGDSEFFINKRPCRLRDIHRLLANTGLGKDSMAIIGQNRVDAVLNSKPEERRLIFEDVAGISGYKLNKEDAQRKLNATERNMERVQDLMSTLEEQLEGLFEKAEQTKKYNLLSAERRLYTGALRYDDFLKAEKQCQSYEEENGKLDLQLASLEEELAAKEEEKKSFRNDEAAKGEERQEVEKNIALAQEENHGLEKEEALLKQKEENISHSLKDREEQLREVVAMIKGNSTKIDLLAMEMEKAQGEGQEKGELLAKWQKAYEATTAEKDSLQKTWDESLDSERTRQMDREKLVADRQALETKILFAKKAIEEGQEKKESLLADVENAEQSYQVVQKEGEEVEVLYEDAFEKEASAKKDEEEALSFYERLQEENRLAARSLQKIQGRLEILESQADEHEGYSRAVKAVLDAHALWREGIHGPLGELFTVEKKYITAIETALGSRVHDIICTDGKVASQAISYLKTEKAGRATFLPLSDVRARKEDEGPLKEEGVINIAKRCLSYDSKYENIFSFALGQIYIVDTMAHALAVQKKYGGKLRLITLEGEVFAPGGSITGGSIAKKGKSLLARREERDSLRLEEETLVRTVKEGFAKEEEALLKWQDAKNKQKECQKVLEEQSLAMSREQVKKAASEENLQRKRALMEEAVRSIEEAQEQIVSITAAQEALEREWLQLTENTVSKEEHEKMRETLDALLKKQQAEKEQCLRMELEQKQWKRIIEEKEHQYHECIENKKRYTEKEVELKEKLEEMRAQVEAIPERKKEIAEKRSVVEQTLQELEMQRIQLKKAMEAEQRNFEKVLDEMAHLQSRRDTLQRRKGDMAGKITGALIYKERALQELTDIGYTREEAKEISVEGNAQDWARHAAKLDGAIEALGIVNPNAIAEYEEAKERFDFLENQKNDLQLARTQLEDIIQELDKEMAKQFLDVFEIVSQHFSTIFSELFGGGRAKLVITNREKILESGIEMYIEPPGKKLQQLSLLSGGERALTVIALLFAFLDYRPAPFCVLDEVDAPLDEANVERFARYISTLQDRVQFIVVTHRKKTMEYAKVLQGVTMMERGVSKLLSVSFDEVEGDL